MAGAELAELCCPGQPWALQEDLQPSGNAVQPCRLQDNAEPWTMLRTCSRPMATRQNLLPWPASGSSSGSETPERGVPKIPARSVQEELLISGKKRQTCSSGSEELLHPILYSESSSMKEFAKLSCLPAPRSCQNGLSSLSSGQHIRQPATIPALCRGSRSDTNLHHPTSATISSVPTQRKATDVHGKHLLAHSAQRGQLQSRVLRHSRGFAEPLPAGGQALM